MSNTSRVYYTPFCCECDATLCLPGEPISAAPSEHSEHTVHFYLRCGCAVTLDPDPELYALEPEDIRFELAL